MPTGGLIGAGSIDPAQVARFRADLEALTGAPPSPASRIGIAVSGGGDSMALLLLAHATWPGSVAAATVDHGLRPEAAAEAQIVGDLCDGLAIPHAVLRVGERPAAGNLQDWARAARYRLLADWARASGVGHVATGHHRDDVAESFLMRAARGGGVRSLAAMPAVRALVGSPVLLVRPLLGWHHAELAAIVAAAGIVPVKDPSNTDARFDRVRLRQLLADSPDLPPEGIARTAGNLRDVEEAFEWMVTRETAIRLTEGDDGIRLDVEGLPFELKRRLVARAIHIARERAGLFAPWRETNLPALVRSLDAGGGGTVADVVARAMAGGWQFTLAPPRRPPKSAADAPK